MTSEPAAEGIQSGVSYIFYSDTEWNPDIGLHESGYRVLDLVALNEVAFLKVDWYGIASIFDYDPYNVGSRQCFSPGGEYELLLYNFTAEMTSLLHYRIGPDGEQGFIYEWQPGGSFSRLWCMESYFIVVIADGTLCRGHFGEPVYPWPIGKPERRWYLGRAW